MPTVLRAIMALDSYTRAITLARAYEAHPERFVRHAPRPPDFAAECFTDV